MANIQKLFAMQFLLLAFFLADLSASPLSPIKLDHPRDTMATFMSAMADYKKGVDTNDSGLEKRLSDAIRTLNLTGYPAVLRKEKGKEAAVLLKEVVDRVILIDLTKVPNDTELLRWRLKDTEIVVGRVEKGDRSGEYLFTTETVARLPEFFEKVKHLPYLRGSGKGAGFQESWLKSWYENHVPAWAKKKFLAFDNWQWIGLFVAILLGLSLRVFAKIGLQIVRKVAVRKKGAWDDQFLDAVEKPLGLIVACAFWYFSIHVLRFQGTALYVFTVAVQLLLSVGVIHLFYRLADIAANSLKKIAESTDTPLDDHLIRLIRKSLRIFVVVFGVLVVIQNLGFNVMSIFAGLGLGGLAFALAAKDTAANLFGSMMIFLDKPFGIGDWIQVGGQEGIVKDIGFRSTRIRTFYDSMISIPNSVVASSHIDNYGRRDYRRIRANLGLTYDTPPEKLEAFLEGVKNIIKANPYTRKDYFHVVFEKYSASSLDILLYCFLKVPTWDQELVERQNIYLEILRLAKDLEVSFAFPTQTLHIESTPEKEQSLNHQELKPEILKAKAKAFDEGGEQSRPSGFGIFTPPYKEN